MSGEFDSPPAADAPAAVPDEKVANAESTPAPAPAEVPDEKVADADVQAESTPAPADVKPEPAAAPESKAAAMAEGAVVIEMQSVKTAEEKSNDGQELFTYDICLVFQLGEDKEVDRQILDREQRKAKKVKRQQVVLENEKAGGSMSKMEDLHKKSKVNHKEYNQKQILQYINRVAAARLKTKYHEAGKYGYLQVGATEERLKIQADVEDMVLPTNGKQVLKSCVEKKVKLAMHAINYSELPIYKDVQATVFDNLFFKYDTEEHLQHLYATYEDEGDQRKGTIFRQTDRIKLLVHILEGNKDQYGCGFSLETTCNRDKEHPLVEYFPLHAHERLDALRDKWMGWDAMIFQPVAEIREYFGEEVGLYFSFLQTMTRMFIIPAGFGVCLSFYQYSKDSIENGPAIDGYTAFIIGICFCLWTTLLLEVWKREQSRLCVTWGMFAIDEADVARADFEGDLVINPVNGNYEERDAKQGSRACLSYSLVFTVIFTLLVVIIGTIYLRKTLIDWDEDLGPQLASLINGLCITLFDAMYKSVSVRLNAWENPRSDRDYNDSLMWKRFFFRFVNSYNALFYITFWERFGRGLSEDTTTNANNETIVYPGCTSPDDPYCIGSIQVSLLIIYGTQLILNNFIELCGCIPFWYGPVCKHHWYERDVREHPEYGRCEREFKLNGAESTFADYEELVVTYGFTCLFFSAFYLGPFMALVAFFCGNLGG
jgi:hypothetical protein